MNIKDARSFLDRICKYKNRGQPTMFAIEFRLPKHGIVRYRTQAFLTIKQAIGEAIEMIQKRAELNT